MQSYMYEYPYVYLFFQCRPPRWEGLLVWTHGRETIRMVYLSTEIIQLSHPSYVIQTHKIKYYYAKLANEAVL